MQRNILTYSFILLLLSACSFDTDSDFYMETEAAYLLSTDSLGQNSLWRIAKDRSFIANWNQAAGVENENLGDVFVKDARLWLSDVQNNRLIQWDLEADEEAERYELGDLVPNFICEGDKYVLICDTVNQKLGFMKVRNGELEILDAERNGGPAKAISGNFFIISEDTFMSIYSEVALGLISESSFNHPIYDSQLDERAFLHLYTSDDSNQRYFARIDVNANLKVQNETEINFRKRRFSPYLYQPFQKEWTETVTLGGGNNLDVGGLTDVSDFELDFFESEVYFIQSSNLYVYKLNEAQLDSVAPFAGNLKKAYFFQNFQNPS